MSSSNNQPEYANMSSSSLAALNKSRPPASPPLQHAPPPPPPSTKPPHLHPTAPITMQRNFIRSPNTTIPMATPTPSEDVDLLTQLGSDDLISRILGLEQKNRKLLFDNGALMKDLNMHLSQLQQLKHQNFQLLGDNNELRDLCCYLDDERSKARSVAREWQSFGNHMSRVMRQEVTQYSTKLTQLESKQFELVRENFELKQLCLLLDNAISVRENGDGSTGSMASNGEENSPNSDEQNNNSQTLTGSAAQRQHHRVIISQQILEYIKSLEEKIRSLEYQQRCLKREQRLSSGLPANAEQMDQNQQDDTGVQCPPAIAEAMRVLRIHDSMNEEVPLVPNGNSNGTTTGSTKKAASKEEEFAIEQQRAIVRSLCNVAWRKIEDGS